MDKIVKVFDSREDHCYYYYYYYYWIWM